MKGKRMSAYCTIAELTERIGAVELAALSDLDGDGALDTATVNNAIQDASAHIDSYAQEKYAVPFSPIPDVITKRAVILSIYFLQLWRDSVTDAYAQAKRDVDTWLMALAKGTVSPGISPKPAESAGAATVKYNVDPRRFGRGHFL